MAATAVEAWDERMARECRPIVNDPPLRGDCLSSFDTYEPVRPGYATYR